MEFDLSLFLKEIQLQHGLRAEDYARYRRYTTSRLATLRHQLGLVHDSKKFQPREVTQQNATKPEHLQLLVLCAERCWAAAEDMQEKRRAAANGGEKRPAGGIFPSSQFRKRLNKSVKWASKLHAVGQVVAGQRLKQEVEAYTLEVRGRAAAAHGLMDKAKEYFLTARERYYSLRSCSTPEQWVILLTKVTELDDRVVYCMLRLGEDTSCYKPHLDLEDTTQQLTATTIEWNGRHLSVASIKVKDALRELRALNIEAAKAKAMELGGPIPLGQQNKVLDLMDRRIGCLNDAMAHARQDLRTLVDDRQRTELQLLVHYLLFQVSYETLQRTLFMVVVYVRRFCATEKSIAGISGTGALWGSNASGKNKKEFPPMQYASPLEIVRLYDAALETLSEMELLPGVTGRADVEELNHLCRAGKLLYLGESWRILKESARAQSCYNASLSVLEGVTSTPQIEAFRLVVEKCFLQMVSSKLLSTTTFAVASGGRMTENVKKESGKKEEEGTGDKCEKEGMPLQYLVDAADRVTMAQNIIKFPPDYQAVPCKPVFVDIASIYIEYPTSNASSPSEKPKVQRTEGASSSNEGKRWRWGWGWRK